MTPQQLKNAILQQAIQGKLVEQRAEEGTGEELYKVIQDEKQQLIQEGKLKKQKALPEITEDEIPFEIPETWKWVRLGEISTYSQTKKKINVAAIETPMWSLDLEDIEKESGKIIRRVMTIDRKISGEKIIFKKDQILYSKLRPYLKKILIAPDNGVCSSELVPFDMIGNCDSRFIVYLLKSAYVDFLINSVTYGVKMPRVGTDTMINLLIPLPPLAEQERIVEKIEEFLPLVERYEKAWARLEELNKKFPLDMQKAILGQAIQDEKQKLIQEGKLKKQKALPEITEDEIPFEIPETWKWVRLGEIVTVYGGKRIPVGKKLSLTKTEHVYIRVSDMKDGFVSTENLQYISDDIYEKISNYIIKKEDVYITVAGTIGRIGKIPYELDGANLTENADRLVFSAINQDWLIKTLQSNLVQQQIISSTTKVGQPKLAISRIQTILIPLPPLAEQERIVEKIEELLPLVEKLK